MTTGRGEVARQPPTELAVLIGFPAAGKSTFYARHLAATHVHVSKDAMPRGAHKARRQRRLITQALAEGRSVAVDNVNATRADRAELIAIAASAGARIVGYWLDASTRECVGRNSARTGSAKVPTVAIFAAAKRFEAPVPEEGFAALWRVRTTATCETPAFDLERIVS